VVGGEGWGGRSQIRLSFFEKGGGKGEQIPAGPEENVVRAPERKVRTSSAFHREGKRWHHTNRKGIRFSVEEKVFILNMEGETTLGPLFHEGGGENLLEEIRSLSFSISQKGTFQALFVFLKKDPSTGGNASLES